MLLIDIGCGMRLVIGRSDITKLEDFAKVIPGICERVKKIDN